jgi:glutamine synthetase
MQPQRPTGMLSESALRDLVAKREVDTVLTVFPDLYGRLVGKRYAADFFCDHVLGDGMHV